MQDCNKMRYMTDAEAKKMILQLGRRMYQSGFVVANDGNISCRVGANELWTTPTGVSKGFMTADMLVKTDLQGHVLMGDSAPTSELKMHLRVYHENPCLTGVTHAHPPIATSFAVAGIALDQAILPEAIVQLGTVPVTKYTTPGTQDVPNAIAPYVHTHNAVLLANHGALTWGVDLFQAYARLESLEHYAKILLYTGHIIAKAHILSSEQVEELLEIRTKLGITSGGAPVCAAASNTQDIFSTELK